MLKNPSGKIVEATKRVVAQMANGGLQVPSEWLAPEARAKQEQEAKDIVVKLHAWLPQNQKSKVYEIIKKANCPVPGSRTGKRTGSNRVENLEAAVKDYPYLVRVEGYDVLRLDVDVARLESLLKFFGKEDLGGGLEGWGVYWDLRAYFADFNDQDWEAELQNTLCSHEESGDVLSETINVALLQDEIHDKVGQQFDVARQLIRRHAQEGTRSSDFSTVEVLYYRKHGLAGRRYARGPSVQHLSKSLRLLALRSESDIGSSLGAVFEVFDVDIDNCFAQLLWNELHRLVGDAVDIDYSTFTAFVKNPGKFKTFLSQYLSLPIKAVKKSLAALLHCARPQSELPLLWALAVEFRMAAKVVLESPAHAHLMTKFSERKHPLATRLHYALSSVEDSIVRDVEKAVQEAFGERAQIITYMFDGLIVRMANLGCSDSLRKILDDVGKRRGVHFSLEKF